MLRRVKGPLEAVLRPLRPSVTWACQRGWLPEGVRQVLPWGWTLEPFTIYGTGWKCRWYPTEFDAVGHRVFWSGLREWEKETSPVILEEIRRSRCFLDIGANCGIYTVMGCALNPGVRAVAVEPVPRVYAALARNVAGNDLAGRVTVLNVALGEENGVVGFHEAEDSTMGSLAVSGYGGQQGRVIQVECRTLDAVVAELGVEPDFLKIDVEGFEHAVLAGGLTVLDRWRPRIVLEANPGDPAERVTAILARFGYTFSVLTERGPRREAGIVPEPEYRNWLCVPGEGAARGAGA